MSNCIRAEACSFFNNKMKASPTTAEMFRKNYCFADADSCARNRIFEKLLQGFSPADDAMMERIEKELKHLYPNDSRKAETIIGWLVKY